MATGPRPKQAFASAAQVVRVDLRAQRIAGNPMEPKACVAAYDAGTGNYNIYMPTQGMSDIRNEFAYVTGVERERFRIHAHDVGGAFGVRNEIYPEFAALVCATKRSAGRSSGSERAPRRSLSDHHGRGAALSGELAIDKDGNFLGLRIGWLVNLGAYCSNAGPSSTRRRHPPAWRRTPTALPRSTDRTGWSSPTRRRPPPIAAPAGPTFLT